MSEDRAPSESTPATASLRPVDPESRIPLYLQVMSSIETAVRSKLLPAGTRLPAEDELRAIFGVSRTTLRQAIGRLASRGVVERRHGAGTWISRQAPINTMGGLQSIYQELSDMGRHPETELISLETVEADATLAEATGFAVGDRLHAVTRLRSADGSPVMFDRSWFLAPDFELQPEDLAGSLDTVLRKHGSVPASVRQVLTPRLANEDEAGALGIDIAPVIVSHLWAYDADQRLLRHTELTFSPVNYRFQTTHFPEV